MAFTCPVCLRTSQHPRDEQHGYCARCHLSTGNGPDSAYAGRHLASDDPLEYTAACLERALYEETRGGDWLGSMMSDLAKFDGDRAALAATDPRQWGELLEAGYDATNARIVALGLPPLRRDPY
jgi:hypothetical protein